MLLRVWFAHDIGHQTIARDYADPHLLLIALNGKQSTPTYDKQLSDLADAQQQTLLIPDYVQALENVVQCVQ